MVGATTSMRPTSSMATRYVETSTRHSRSVSCGSASLGGRVTSIAVITIKKNTEASVGSASFYGTIERSGAMFIKRCGTWSRTPSNCG
ncbi:hypothetical protein D3C84_1178400 [compost metagenome]